MGDGQVADGPVGDGPVGDGPVGDGPVGDGKVPSRPADMTSEGMRRLRVVAFVLAVAVLFGVLDRASAAQPNASAVQATVQRAPVAAPAGALSSSWFCAGATAAPTSATSSPATSTAGSSPASSTAGSSTAGSSTASSSPEVRPSPYGEAQGQLVIANAGLTAATATVTDISSGGSAVESSVKVPARGSLTVPENASGGTGWEGAIVEVDAGQVVVDQSVNGPLGASSSPCATSGSPTWYLPTGQTLINADEYVSLLNPYPTATIVDLSFLTNQGNEQPQNFQGIDVPADGLVSVDLGAYLTRRSAIETTVTARMGSVVAWETEIVTPPPSDVPLVGSAAAAKPLADPAWPIAGVTVTLGAPAAATSWVWPDGLAGAGMQEKYVVFNPGSTTANVRLSIGLTGAAAEPFSFSVRPGQIVPVVSEQQARIPAGVAHSATLLSINGVPVVAERTLTASQAAIPVAGAKGIVDGNGQILGGTLRADSWIVGAAEVDANHVGQLVIFNPGSAAVSARATRLSPDAPASLLAGGAVTLPPGGRAALGVLSEVSGPLEVTATSPVFVEYDLYGTGGSNGVGLSFAVPLSRS